MLCQNSEQSKRNSSIHVHIYEYNNHVVTSFINPLRKLFNFFHKAPQKKEYLR